MKFELPFGTAKISVDIPDDRLCAFLKPKDLPAPAPAEIIIRGALSHPLGAESISSLISRGTRVAIVVDDQTRSSPIKEMVALVLEDLKKAGARDDDITIIFAVGAHRQTEPDEARRILGREVSAKYRWIAGDCRKMEDFVPVGRTSRGNEVRIFRSYVEADIKILLGDIEYNHCAGYTGGRESILPGISAHPTIQFNYKLVSGQGGQNCRAGCLNGNPVHEDMVEAARMASVDFCLNTIRNSRGQVFAAIAGSPDQVLRNGMAIVDQIYKVPVKEKADIVVVSAGGAPTDSLLYNAENAIESALPALKDGGIIILAAECKEGIGNDACCELMGKKSFGKAKVYAQTAMDKIALKEKFGIEGFDSIQEALAKAMQEKPEGRIIVLPVGNSTLLCLEQQAAPPSGQ
ncbi:MAG: nickel-dependent lactate racemase [Candidatus Thermoplasmatota archaeon]|nr:nickel-dependent lactate racemase [Candidatus Thermoplasmatota archaeon]